MISFLHIALILLKLGDWYLYHIIGIFIFYKMKEKVYFNTHFFHLDKSHFLHRKRGILIVILKETSVKLDLIILQLSYCAHWKEEKKPFKWDIFHFSTQNRSDRIIIYLSKFDYFSFMCYVIEWTLTLKIILRQNVCCAYIKGL